VYKKSHGPAGALVEGKFVRSGEITNQVRKEEQEGYASGGALNKKAGGIGTRWVVSWWHVGKNKICTIGEGSLRISTIFDR